MIDIEKVVRDIASYFKDKPNLDAAHLTICPLASGMKLFCYKNLFNNYFSALIPSRQNDRGIFFHTLRLEYAKKALETKEFRFYSLSSVQDKDYAEQIECYRRYATPYADFGLIKKSNENIFILCLSKDIRNEKMWEEYGNMDCGISLGFRYEHKYHTDNPGMYDFRDVYYDSGYDLDFLNELQNHLYESTGQYINVDSISTFAKFYKRDKFRWENETRICFERNPCNICGQKLFNFPFEIEHDENMRSFIRVPFENDFFHMTLSEIICGKNVSAQDYNILKNTYPNVCVWQRA